MKSRIPLTVAVVGALLIGGATTGTTRASWREQLAMIGDAVRSAQSMAFSTSVPPARQTLTQASGFITATVTIADVSSDEALNLRQSYSVSSVSSTLAGISVSVTSSCPSSPPTASTTGYTTGALFTTKPAAVDETGVLCVAVAAASGGGTGNGDVTVHFKGTQVRPGGANINGWTSTNTFTVPIAVNSATAVPSAPQVSQATSCVGRKSDNQYTIAWGSSASGSPTSYRVHKATNPSGPFVDQGAAISPYDASTPDNGTTYWRVTAINATGSSVASNTIVITRTKTTGPAVFTCQVTTP